MGLFNKNEEKEVSGGAVFGWALLGMAAVLVIAFIVFMILK